MKALLKYKLKFYIKQIHSYSYNKCIKVFKNEHLHGFTVRIMFLFCVLPLSNILCDNQHKTIEIYSNTLIAPYSKSNLKVT